MTRINLLPPEIRERQAAKRNTTIIAVVGLLVILGLAFFYVMKQLELSDVNRQLADQQAVNAQLQADIAALQSVDQKLAEIAQKEQLLVLLLQNEVRWSGVLRDISLVIPSDAWLESLAASVSDPLGATATTTESGIIGSVSFSGLADRHPTVALWLTRLAEVRGFLNPWISSSTKTAVADTPLVKFESTVDLSVEITSQRGRQP